MNRIEFEVKALEAAGTIVNRLLDAEMYAGTLFVRCDSKQAAKIETALIESLKCGVIVSKVGPEYSFDFVGG